MASTLAMKTLPGQVPAAIARFHLQSVGELPSDTNLNFVISLPLRNQKEIGDLLAQIYNPASTNYHHYLRPNQFYAQFGPSQADYQKVVNFAKASGFAIVATHSNQMLLDVRGKVSDIEAAFGVTLRTYPHPTEPRDFYAPDRDPVINSNLPIAHISGLDNFVIPHPMSEKIALTDLPMGAARAVGSGPDGLYMGTDFRAAYAPGVTLDGSGQSVALFELDGYYPSDILSYETQAGLPDITLTNIAVNGGVSTPGAGSFEVTLDIDMAIAMATNLSKVIVYEAPNSDFNSPVDLLNKIASDDLANQVSSSWGIGDDPAFDPFYIQMALQGQSFFQASGDDGAYYPGIEQWADDTNITLVGGTVLSTSSPGGSWSSETAWNLLIEGQALGPDGQTGGGGGTNINGVPIPGWQQGVKMVANQGSTTLRNVPDVALTADDIYVVYGGGEDGAWGTSAAAPLWAGFAALINQQAVENGLPAVGFLNPAIYAIGESTNYQNCFHDITTGNNTNLVVGNAYFAVPGYDLCTGWGTPSGSNLINALTFAPITNIYTHLSAPLPPYGTTLSALNGGNPNGNWELFVQDDEPLNFGYLSNGWAITLTTGNPIGYVADNSLTMSASATNVLPNSDVVFSIGVTNYGPSTASNVVVSDAFPVGFTFVSANVTQGSLVPGTFGESWNVGNLVVNTGAQMTLTLEAPNTPEQFAQNSASVSAQTVDQNPADASVSVTLNVVSTSPPSLSPISGAANGKFLLSVSSATSEPVVIQASTNLVNWVNVWTNTPPFTFTDSVSPVFPYRFYRATVQ